MARGANFIADVLDIGPDIEQWRFIGEPGILIHCRSIGNRRDSAAAPVIDGEGSGSEDNKQDTPIDPFHAPAIMEGRRDPRKEGLRSRPRPSRYLAQVGKIPR